MWVAGGAAMVLAAVVLVVAALLERDRVTVRPRRTGTVTAQDLRAANLPVAWRGYDRGHVDALLARAATTIEQVQRYGVLDESDPTAAMPDDRRSAGPPSFLAGAVNHADSADDAPGDRPAPSTRTGDEEPTSAEEPASAEGPTSANEPGSAEGPASGEELEDRGGDDAGGLDR